jgi:hypothetical protein
MIDPGFRIFDFGVKRTHIVKPDLGVLVPNAGRLFPLEASKCQKASNFRHFPCFLP